MTKQPSYTLTDFAPGEGDKVKIEIDAVLQKYSAQIVCRPVIEDNGTLGAKVELYKKVELIPKEEGVASPRPINENGEKNKDKTGEEADTTTGISG